MGLYITAWSKATLVSTDADPENTLADEEFITGPDFPERLDNMPEGVYRFSGDVFEFFAGRFSEFNAWRRQLSQLAIGIPLETIWEHPGDYGDRPFFELLQFGDNEGAIGPITSRKLAHDFAEYAEQLQHLTTIAQSSIEYGTNVVNEVTFVEQYANFRQAFELASDEGFVIFG